MHTKTRSYALSVAWAGKTRNYKVLETTDTPKSFNVMSDGKPYVPSWFIPPCHSWAAGPVGVVSLVSVVIAHTPTSAAGHTHRCSR